MANTTRTIRVKFDGDEKGLIAAAAKAGLAVEGFEKQAKKSAVNVASAGGGLIDALGALPSVLKGAAIVAAVGIGAVMAPALASAIISGVLLAVGGGVLAAGIIGAAKSPKVVKAWQRFGRQAEVVFQRFSKPFIAPLERAARTFSQALARAEPIIGRIGATIAPVIDKLAPAFAGLAEKALPGILAAAQASVPLFDVLAANLPGIGGSLALFFQALAAGAPAAQQFFSGFLGWVQDILPKLGGFVTWLADLGVKMDAFTKGPEFTGLKTALIDFKDTVLVGVKSGFSDIRISILDNSETWKQLGKDIETVLKLLGPGFSAGVNNTLTGIAFLAIAFGKLYDAVNGALVVVVKLIAAIDLLFRNYSRLPGNLSGNGTNVQYGRIPGRARGGGVGPYRDYLVGEQGPEILRMGARGGTVIPNHEIGGVGAGPTHIEIPIYIGDEVVRVVRHEISERDRAVRRGVAMAGA